MPEDGIVKPAKSGVVVHGPRILCVDDNHDIADSTADLLQLMGYETRTCYGGSAALTEAASFLPDVCLIDLSMTGMDGDELALRLREAFGPMVMIAVTAMSSEISLRRIKDAGFDAHLVKPADPSRLFSVIGLLLT
jgi:two-component system OmpR family response regulator